jgi:hypothetical protein
MRRSVTNVGRSGDTQNGARWLRAPRAARQ